MSKKNENEKIYKMLKCSTFDIISCGDFDIFIDDEGLFVQENPIIRITLFGTSVTVAGTFLISKGSDEDGKTLWFDVNDERDRLTVDNIISDTRNLSYPIGFVN